MREQFPRGSVARIYFDIISAGIGVISLNPTIAIQRKLDGKWFELTTGLWMPTAVDHTMTQLDSANFQGRYFFDFDQSLDLLAASNEYLAKLVNVVPSTLQYRDLLFGPIPSVVAPRICAIRGTIFDPQAKPEPNVVVRATIEPVHTDSLGRTTHADRVVETYTNDLGDFELQLIQGVTVRLEIDAVGYDRRVVVPSQSIVLFTDL